MRILNELYHIYFKGNWARNKCTYISRQQNTVNSCLIFKISIYEKFPVIRLKYDEIRERFHASESCIVIKNSTKTI